jgi:hypothetical protein
VTVGPTITLEAEMQTKTNLYEAHRQWASRPSDQRFHDLNALYNFTLARRATSTDRNVQIRELKVVALDSEDLAINSQIPKSTLTHWSFSQICSQTRTPAGYLRSLPAELAKECLQKSILRTGGNCKLLLTADGADDGHRTIGAITGPAYGRIWDADVVENLRKAVEGTTWHVPPARPAFGSDFSGLYASDRDMFAFLVNDEKPIEVGNARLGRGFFLWNSEVGSATLGLTTFLYNYVCGNHIVWDAEQVRDLRIIHRKSAPERFSEQAMPMLNRFVESRGNIASITDTVASAMKTPIGQTLEETQKWFKSKAFSQREVVAAWSTGIQEGEDVTTLWGMLQGFTAQARQYAHVDARVNLEWRAGQLLTQTN